MVFGKYEVDLFVIGFAGLSIETKGFYALLAKLNDHAAGERCKLEAGVWGIYGLLLI